MGTVTGVSERDPQTPRAGAQDAADKEPTSVPLDTLALDLKERLRHIGTNAIPTLLRRLRAKDSPLTLRLVALAQKQHLLIRLPETELHGHRTSQDFWREESICDAREQF